MRFLGKARPWAGGDQIILPIKIQKSTSLGSYSGLDTFTTAQTSERIMASVDPKQYYASIVISGIQEAVNAGEGRLLDLLATEMESKAADLKDDMADGFYSDGTTNSSKVITGVHAACDDSTNVTTYEGISRSTYVAWKGNYNEQSGALTEGSFYTDINEAEIGNDAPTVCFTTPAVFSLYEALLDDEVRYTLSFAGYDKMTASGMQKGSNTAAGTGFNSLYCRGIPVVADEQATSGNAFWLNEKHIWMYSFRKHPKHGGAAKSGFFWTGLKEPTNQDGSVGQLLWYGNLACDGPRFLTRRYSITT